MNLRASGSQTVGPFFALGLGWLYSSEIRAAGGSGERVEIRGRIYDGAAAPVPDAVLEVWQADAAGRHATGPGLSGFGRVPVDATGAFSFSTVKPGRVPAAGGRFQAPHLSIHVFMRGLLLPFCTRLYFPGEAANAEDLVLARVPAARRHTLIARARPDALHWDIHLQGDQETVCFQY